MKKALMIASILFVAVISTACINNIAVQELNNKAAEYMEKGDYESAMNRLQASLDLDSSMYETYYNLGIAAINAKKFDKAIEALEGGVAIKPDFAEFYYSLGVAQIELADELVTPKEEASDKKVEAEAEGDVDKPSEADNKAKAIDLKTQAIENLKKYLEMKPNAEDQQTVKELIADSSKFLEKEDSSKVGE